MRERQGRLWALSSILRNLYQIWFLSGDPYWTRAERRQISLGPEQESKFNNLKRLISKADYLAYFGKSAKLVLLSMHFLLDFVAF